MHTSSSSSSSSSSSLAGGSFANIGGVSWSIGTSHSTMVAQLSVVNEAANKLFNSPLHHCSQLAATTSTETGSIVDNEDHVKQACLSGWRRSGHTNNNNKSSLSKLAALKCYKGSSWLSAFVVPGSGNKDGEDESDVVGVVKCDYINRQINADDDPEVDLLASILGEEKVLSLYGGSCCDRELSSAAGLNYSMRFLKPPKLGPSDESSGSGAAKVLSLAIYGGDHVAPDGGGDDDKKEELMLLVSEAQHGELCHKLIK
jgi:hypothetical protein